MRRLDLAGVVFTLRFDGAPGTAQMDRAAGGRILVHENGAPCEALRAERLGERTTEFLAAHLAQEAARMAEARAETAAQMWAEYVGGPEGGWRAAGETSAEDIPALAEALGAGVLDLLVDPDGTVAMAEVQWANTDLFLGHSVFTQIYDPMTWSRFDTTLFG